MHAQQLMTFPPMTDPNEISRLLTRYVAKLQDKGVTDHKWILYALSDIAEYCHEHRMADAGLAIESTIEKIEDEVILNTVQKVH